MRRKRSLATLLAAMLALTVCVAALPKTALAAGDRTIQLGTDGLEANDKVYFGKYGAYNVPWVVLPSATLSQTSTTATNTLPLLSEYLLGKTKFREDSGSGYYSGSTLQSAMATILSGFDSKEQGAVAGTTLIGDSMCAGQSDLSGQKLFPLSYNEAFSLVIGSSILQAKRIDDATSSDRCWWLRSSDPDYTTLVKAVDALGGTVSFEVYDTEVLVRPTCNLDTSKVLFAAAANNSGQNATFSAPAAYSGTEWKLTIKDGNSFAVGATQTSGNTVLQERYAAETLTFSHAALSSFTGAGYTNVTATLTNAAGALLYYGSVNADVNATNTTVTIPTGLVAGSYVLSLYGEDRNAANTTDYATGTPIVQLLTVIEDPTPSFTVHPQSQTIAEGQSVTFTVAVTGTGPISLQWCRLANGGSWDPITGETGTSYTIPSVDFALNGRQYCCWAKNSVSSTISSNPATLTVTRPAAYDLQFAANTEFTNAAAKTIDFGTVTQGYSQPAAKYVIVRNAGNSAVKLQQPTFSPAAQAGNYTVVRQTGWENELSTTEARNFTVRPNANLPVGNYDADITIGCTDVSGNPTSASCTMHVKFTVTTAVNVSPTARFPQGNAPNNLTLNIGSAGNPPNSAAHFGRLEISGDGTNFTVVDPANYALTYGSIHVALAQNYLNTLTPGNYTLHIYLAGAFAGAPLITYLTVTGPGGDTGGVTADVPKTGDGSTPLLWLGLALFAGAGLMASAALGRRKRRGN